MPHPVTLTEQLPGHAQKQSHNIPNKASHGGNLVGTEKDLIKNVFNEQETLSFYVKLDTGNARKDEP